MNDVYICSYCDKVAEDQDEIEDKFHTDWKAGVAPDERVCEACYDRIDRGEL